MLTTTLAVPIRLTSCEAGHALTSRGHTRDGTRVWKVEGKGRKEAPRPPVRATRHGCSKNVTTEVNQKIITVEESPNSVMLLSVVSKRYDSNAFELGN